MGIGIGLFWLIVAIVVVYLIYKLIKSERSLHQAGQSSEAPRIFCLKGTPRESWSLMDGRVEEFLKRPIEHPIPYLFIDASYSKVRTDSRYITKAFLIVTAIRDDGDREILGARIADGEDELFWTEFFDALKDRGLSGEKLVVSNSHKGIQKAVEKSFLGASWKMCRVLFIRAVLRNVAKKYHKKLRIRSK